jgi:hypothetical protein
MLIIILMNYWVQLLYLVGNGMRVYFSMHCTRCPLIALWSKVIVVGSRPNARAVMFAIERVHNLYHLCFWLSTT